MLATDEPLPVRVVLDKVRMDKEGKASMVAQESGNASRFPVSARSVREARQPSDCQISAVQFAGSSVDIA